MDKWDVDLARLFKERDNVPQEGATTGKVITPFPLVVSLGAEIMLDEDDLVISNRVHEMDLIVDDEVILIPTASGQKYFVIDKVGV